MKKIKVGLVVGSARRGSYSRSIANALAGLLPEGFEITALDIGNLPMFNQDYDDDGATPPQWQVFRGKVREMDAFLFVTPEYNRSIPPVLKNALDIASRPYGQNTWGGKPGAVISVSPGNPGGFGANHHLRQCLSFLNIYTMQQPEAYIGHVDKSLDENGNVTNESTVKFLNEIAGAYAAWVQNFA